MKQQLKKQGKAFLAELIVDVVTLGIRRLVRRIRERRQRRQLEQGRCPKEWKTRA
jgi:hypothetical protein